ncbi:MAG: hydrogenase maturation protease [Acidobacteria bacterium]|nr:hydrogenase maturation protease [Acidobacteriota bacterium]
MTAGSASPQSTTEPLLVLGLGNLLLRDDGVGLELLKRLEGRFADAPGIELVEGGTQGLALLPFLERRPGLLVLDAAAFGAAPGTVHVMWNPEHHAAPRGIGAHEGNAGELLDAARLIGYLPEQVCLVGVEPADISTGIGLSGEVEGALEAALEAATAAVARLTAS